jgi:hypothetical protein
METAWRVDRTTLWALWHAHPDRRHADFATTLHRSSSWVGKWLRRFRTTSDCETAVQRASRARHHLPTPLSALVIDRVLAIRDQPPEQLGRIPGPKAILY